MIWAQTEKVRLMVGTQIRPARGRMCAPSAYGRPPSMTRTSPRTWQRCLWNSLTHLQFPRVANLRVTVVVLYLGSWLGVRDPSKEPGSPTSLNESDDLEPVAADIDPVASHREDRNNGTPCQESEVRPDVLPVTRPASR